MTADVAVIILTFNEEANIAHALGSVCDFARQIFVLDSHSTDQTIEIATRFPCSIHQRAFDNYGAQRNFALTELPIEAEWIFFLDADERPSEELKTEIAARIAERPAENGFLVARRLIWMGKWIRRGYYPTWLLRLFRRGYGRCEDRSVNEHIVVDGPVGKLSHDLMHEDHNGLHRWIQKHNDYATREALELLRTVPAASLRSALRGTQAERKRWVREHLWNRMPPLARPFVYFGYRYLARGGILDGKEALVYHLLQALWFQLLVDAKYLELRSKTPSP